MERRSSTTASGVQMRLEGEEEEEEEEMSVSN